MLIHTWWMDCLRRIRKIRRCGLIGGSVLLGMNLDVSKDCPKPSFFLSCLLPLSQDVKLSATTSAPCLPATMLPTMIVMN